MILAAVLVAACANRTAGTVASSAPPSPAGSSATASPPPPYTAPPPPQAPPERSALPNGVYRTQLPVERARELGIDDPGNAGTWTLTVKDGTFKIECVAIKTPGVECGTHDPRMSAVVEVGTLHGTGTTAWFVHDQVLLVKLTGCVRHSQKIDGCGPEDDYHLDWKVAGNGVSFNNFVGIGDQAGFPELSNWTVQPWSHIA